MAEHDSSFDRLEMQLTGLEDTFGGLEGVTSAFQRELLGVRSSFEKTGREASGMSSSVSSSIRKAFDDVVFEGGRLSDALKTLGGNLAGSALRQAVAPVQKAVGSTISGGMEALVSGLLPLAKGAALSGGRVVAFARGGVIDSPTQFPMRGGRGLMGEAGPEAIMPLARGADGRLGVRGGGGSSVNVTMNISTPDVQGFQRSRSQVAAEMNRALQQGRRNL